MEKKNYYPRCSFDRQSETFLGMSIRTSEVEHFLGYFYFYGMAEIAEKI